MGSIDAISFTSDNLQYKKLCLQAHEVHLQCGEQPQAMIKYFIVKNIGITDNIANKGVRNILILR